ncbi:hypothetical protein, partial [Rhodovulum adriaticum]|uniref:hypothetical protein n=1 Tax=Rhodovulum adriaticum TaxID=35804 RepID=UPI00190555CE
IKEDVAYILHVTDDGITRLNQISKPTKESINTINSGSMFSLKSPGTVSPYAFTAAAANVGATYNAPKISKDYFAELYPVTTHDFGYVSKPNYTGFDEEYRNPGDTTGYYTFDGSYRGEDIEVGGVNKYLVPTGVPGEYEVNVKIKGNRVSSSTGVVIVYDNSNSMAINDRI